MIAANKREWTLKWLWICEARGRRPLKLTLLSDHDYGNTGYSYKGELISWYLIGVAKALVLFYWQDELNCPFFPLNINVAT